MYKLFKWWINDGVDEKFTVIVFNNGLWFQTQVELGANKRWMHEDSCMCVIVYKGTTYSNHNKNFFLFANLHWDSLSYLEQDGGAKP